MANKTIGDLLADFELKHARKRHANENKRAKNKEIQQLETKKRTLLLKKLECAFLVDGSSDEYDQEIQELEETQKKIEQEQGISVAYDCAVCEDTGVVNGQYCNCFLKEIYCQIFHAIDPDTLAIKDMDVTIFDHTEAIIDDLTQLDLVKIAYGIGDRYISDFPATRKQNMLILGKTGLGKTWLLHNMAAKANRKKIDTCLIRSNALFEAFFKHRMGEDIPLAFLKNADLLMIDDLGTEPITQNVTIEYFFDLLNYRLEEKKHTIIATNIDDLQKRYDDRIYSRLKDTSRCLTLRFSGQDLRLK
ncbi:MAG: ATP-binding protein [Christensenella sp.]|uniref:ATP-binding protein n=1 Tax=Christensenella sp. TaxID=1935934 RepID=UPI002B2048B8|nr:ATP-binding protein [Christensenella sp.]MEA5002239.1 ATP-binding protein [Christensenella sp.]